jgi:hypothetical protein
MPPCRKPGHECVSTQSTTIDPGTLCCQQSPPPGLVVTLNGEVVAIDHKLVPRHKLVAEEEPWSGAIPAAIGAPSFLRIPVPGTGGLAIELSPRGWTPKGGSTSVLFIQDLVGKRNLRLDYGYNKTNGSIEWHWNQKGTSDVFGIKNHAPAGAVEQALGRTAKYFKYGGRVLLVAAAIADGYSIVVASKPLRRTVQVVSAWAVGAAGCSAVGSDGAAIGTFITPGVGTAIGGFLGCVVGGFIGYKAAESAAGHVYDWAADTIFTQIPAETKPPAESELR